MRSFLIIGACLAAATGVAIPASATAQPAHLWEIGPNIRGREYSIGMPRHPNPAGRGWYFEFPYPSAEAGHVHYVTFRPGPLSGASRIVVRYRVEAARGVRFVPQEEPQLPATVSLVIQRRGDNWSGRRQFEYFRWYAPAQTVREIAPGQHELTVSLQDPNWISVHGHRSGENPALFAAALEQTERVGLVFGSAGLRGHGVYATRPARFSLISFSIGFPPLWNVRNGSKADVRLAKR